MAGFSADRGQRSLRAEINVTPLVDVVLVLLIIFMVITPLLERGKPVKLPAASSAARASTAETLVLTITADKRLYLEDRAVPDMGLAEVLSDRAGAGAGQLLIKADASLSMAELRPVLRRIKAAGLAQIAFAVVDPAQPGAAR